MRKGRSRTPLPKHVNGGPQPKSEAFDSICVYCGSGLGDNPAYAEAARTLGRALALNGIRLVYGGGGLGLMGEVAKATLEAGGKVTGIIPSFLVEREHMLRDVTDLLVTSDMHQRKKMMFERSDAFVALPGGIGTLEELVEQLTWAQLGQHAKPIVVANIAGFWTPFLGLLEHMRGQAFIRRGLEVRLNVVEDANDIVPRVAALYEQTGAEVAPGALAKF
ncbi:MAG: TIGR00730 family Rossman fold protein [Hyphomicrobium sp.]|uniref:LOG family protein n=1 Tax=Hyphomicrobium sp. TaxID=82 RepID=UPI003D0B8E8F